MVEQMTISIPWDERDGFEPVPNPDMSRHKMVVKRIMASYHEAKRYQAGEPETYQPSEMWIPFIKERQEYIDALNAKDEEALGNLLANFFRNSGSNYVIKYGKWEGYESEEAETLKLRLMMGLALNFGAWKHFVANPDVKELAIPPVGNPFGVYYDDVLITSATFNNHYEAEKIHALVEDIDNPIVGELGAGIGILPYYLMKQIPNLKYIDFDLPEILIITQYFLMMSYPKKRFLLFGEKDFELTRRGIANYDFILLPNFMLRKGDYHLCSVFVNFHSLSEMKYETIAEYMPHITRMTALYLYMENSTTDFVVLDDYHEIKVERFPIDPEKFTRIYKSHSIWNENVYREYLYKKINNARLR